MSKPLLRYDVSWKWLSLSSNTDFQFQPVFLLFLLTSVVFVLYYLVCFITVECCYFSMILASCKYIKLMNWSVKIISKTVVSNVTLSLRWSRGVEGDSSKFCYFILLGNSFEFTILSWWMRSIRPLLCWKRSWLQLHVFRRKGVQSSLSKQNESYQKLYWKSTRSARSIQFEMWRRLYTQIENRIT